jgi:hypothetical protein
MEEYKLEIILTPHSHDNPEKALLLGYFTTQSRHLGQHRSLWLGKDAVRSFYGSNYGSRKY